jgi:hypothetical protein
VNSTGLKDTFSRNTFVLCSEADTSERGTIVKFQDRIIRRRENIIVIRWREGDWRSWKARSALNASERGSETIRHEVEVDLRVDSKRTIEF